MITNQRPINLSEEEFTLATVHKLEFSGAGNGSLLDICGEDDINGSVCLGTGCTRFLYNRGRSSAPWDFLFGKNLVLIFDTRVKDSKHMMSPAAATPFTIFFLVQTAICQITGTYPVLLTSTAGRPQPTGNGNDLLSYPKCAVGTYNQVPVWQLSHRT